ncbi:hypothetical protein STEG23_012980 [Scotinomys teguina]
MRKQARFYAQAKYGNVYYREHSPPRRRRAGVSTIFKARLYAALYTVQRGLPLLSSLPVSWPIIVIDIKDCFFSIPLNSRDSIKFAFTLPSCNHEESDKRYEWVVMPQGMANSPTMCQLYVDKAIAPLRKRFPTLRCVHYMDDILLAAKDKNILEQAYVDLTVLLRKKGLVIGPEKDQRDPVWVPERLVRKIQHREDHGKEDSDQPACPCDDANGDDRLQMGDPVGASETDASPT